MLGAVLALLAVPAEAQLHPLNEAWRWTSYTTASGLPSNHVLDLAEAASGTLWAVTEEGLAWYDDFRWHTVSAARFTDIVSDLEGGIFGIYQQRVHRAVPEGVLQLRLLYEGQPLDVQSIAPLDEETLFLEASTGLYRYHQGQVAPLPLPEDLSRWRSEASSIKRTRSGTIWLTSAGGTYWWDGAAWQRLFEFSPQLYEEDAQGGVASFEGPMYPTLRTWDARRTPRLQEQGVQEPLVQAMDLSPTGGGLLVYVNGSVKLRQDGRWQPLTVVPEPLTHPQVVRYARNGDLWVGGQDRLYHFRHTNDRWERYYSRETEHVNAILYTRTGDLWLGHGNGLTHRRADGSHAFFSAVLDTALITVTALGEDQQGGIWVGSGSGFTGAFRYYQGRWQRYGLEDGLAAPFIHRIKSDRRGRLWFMGMAPGSTLLGLPEPGAFVYDAGRFTRWGEEEGLLSGRVYDFAETADGALWFATLEGISRFHDGTWRHWTTDDGLRRARVFTLAATSDGRLWFGHQSHGLGYLDAAGHVRYLTSADGLVDDSIWYLATGPDGALWIGTREGVGRYHDEVFASFGRAEGLLHPRVWPVVPLEDRVYLGTLGGGLYTLSLDEMRHPPPKVEILPPLVDAQSAYLRWQAHPYRGELEQQRVETRARLDDGPWSPWSTSREISVLDVAPGTHRLRVEAKSLFGTLSPGSTTAFDIATPFHRHPLFLLLLAVLLVGAVVVGQMYVRRQRLQHALLRQREASLAEAQRIARLGSWEFDLGEARFEWSEAVYRIFGCDPGTFTPTLGAVLATLHPDDRGAVETVFRQAGPCGSDLDFPFRVVLPDGGVRYIEGRAEVQCDRRRPVRLHGTMQDVTERKRAEEAIRGAQQELLRQQHLEKERVEDELARAKDRLVRQTRLATIGQVAASIAHELRNPLGAVRNATYFLRRHVPAREAKWSEYLSIIEQEVASADQIIADLLEMSRAKEPTKEVIDLEAAVCQAFAHVKGDEAIRFECVCARRPFYIWADPGQFRQVMINLFTNAVQAMQGVGAILVEAAEDDDETTITVRDGGPGISEDIREFIFDPLYTTKAKGTGLGLAICRQIVERHGGTLDLVEAEAGAVFRLRLPKADVSLLIEPKANV